MTSTFRQTGKNMDTKKFLYALNNLNEKQRSVVEAKENKVLINAGAGSGKTTTVVLKVCKLAYLRNPLSNVLVITFTRKAAEEVKDKLKSLGLSLKESDASEMGVYPSDDSEA